MLGSLTVTIDCLLLQSWFSSGWLLMISWPSGVTPVAIGTVCAPVKPSDSRSTLFMGTNVMLPGSPTGRVPAYAEPPANETPWMDWTWPACVRRSVAAVVEQLIPILLWLPSWRS